MINDDFYLYDAMINMGEMIDSVVNTVRMNPDHFIQMFITQGLAFQIEHHNPKYTVGMSGPELVMDVFFKAYGTNIEVATINNFERSSAYWAGWVLEYCQWKTDFSFEYIQKIMPVSEIIDMYSPYHEASEERMVDILVERDAAYRQNTDLGQRLQAYRKAIGMSQKELADSAKLNKRTLQQYEINGKDLSKASVSSVRALAYVLGCRIEDLI